MTDDLSRLEAAAEYHRQELAKLEAAIALVKQLRGELARETPAEPVRSAEFAGMSNSEVAEALLREAGPEGMHYKALADAAVARGYQSEAAPQALRDAFGRMLRKYPRRFEAVGPGTYRLKGRKK